MPDGITHAAAAKLLQLPSGIVEWLCGTGELTSLGKHGSYYYLDPSALPPRDRVVAAAREAYRAKLRRVVSVADSVIAEVEGVQLDALDALDHYTDPVGAIGDDLRLLVDGGRHSERGVDATLMQLRLESMGLLSLHSSMRDLDGEDVSPPPLRERLPPDQRPRARRNNPYS